MENWNAKRFLKGAAETIKVPCTAYKCSEMGTSYSSRSSLSLISCFRRHFCWRYSAIFPQPVNKLPSFLYRLVRSPADFVAYCARCPLHTPSHVSRKANCEQDRQTDIHIVILDRQAYLTDATSRHLRGKTDVVNTQTNDYLVTFWLNDAHLCLSRVYFS